MKPARTGITRIIYAAGYSMKGLRAAWQFEAAFRQEVCLAAVLTAVSFFLDVTPIEQLFMIATLVIIVLVELINSAIEAAIDRIGSEMHELSGRAKDIGSAAVFVACCFAAFSWVFILCR